MKCRSSTSPFKKRRAVSQIIGSLLILGLVASVGSVLLINGMKQINAFSYDLSFYDKVKNESFREKILFEHVRFDPVSKNISIHLANTGTAHSTITSISVVKLDTQELLVNRVDLNDTIGIGDSVPITVTSSIITPNWNNVLYLSSEYKISITTSKGNFFTSIATPFNT